MGPTRVPLVIFRALSSKARSCVPQEPVFRKLKEHPRVEIPIQTVHLLERLSLVRFGEAEAVTRLEEAVKFAQAIFDVDTSNVEPMHTVLENRSVPLREDRPQRWDPKLVLNNVTKMEEGFIVAPPGNIALKEDERLNDLRS
ncbi:glutamyl-tRNA(Gln) amidotransferase subunit C, mitochondrial [Galendromus occidentalis]|uniref:Glutamyl-tRNA(Gln) amidotransferase subunit C, mitochondrial n=1 Tax=Galendromus occidentalis TaxID=34638 RepID=A0AAJ6QUD6_9ACAR|nr:glutamyl-tRNA(Gln) amidotransferase subunit C, mitochondrial [Galendromus occidentalis]